MAREVVYNDLDEFRSRLPVYSKREKILAGFKKYPTIILTGETACGKTTQVPQYIIERYPDLRGIVACTQPRRIAAISVAKRVAKEKSCAVGTLVGYAVRFEEKTSEATRLKYMSDGLLIREALHDPLLRRYSVIILDEVHERSVNMDILCGIVKAAQLRRSKEPPFKQLKIVLMSATMDTEQFGLYFKSTDGSPAPAIFLPGRLYAVTVHHLNDPKYAKPEDYDFDRGSIVTLIKLNREYPPEYGVLIFSTGQEEIESLTKRLRAMQDQFIADCGVGLDVYPLYANMSMSSQMNAMQSPKLGMRKVVIATNVAESSLTIPYVRIVIDCGWVKRKQHNPDCSVDLLQLSMISQAEAWQRTGRAGREAPGVCFRLYPEDRFESLPENIEPEILRVNLASTCLQLVAMGFGRVRQFDFISPPHNESLDQALDQLQKLDCIRLVVENGYFTTDTAKELFELTKHGKELVRFPVDPRLAKCLIAANTLGCLRSVIRVVGLLSVESILQFSSDDRAGSMREMEKFAIDIGDHLTYLKIFAAFRKADRPKSDWCKRYRLNYRNLSMASKIVKQLTEMCVKFGMNVSGSKYNREGILKSICSGFLLQIAKFYKEQMYRTVIGNVSVNIHPSSVLFRSRPEFVVFRDLLHSNRRYIRIVSAVTPEIVQAVCPASISHKFCRVF